MKCVMIPINREPQDCIEEKCYGGIQNRTDVNG